MIGILGVWALLSRLNNLFFALSFFLLRIQFHYALLNLAFDVGLTLKLHLCVYSFVVSICLYLFFWGCRPIFKQTLVLGRLCSHMRDCTMLCAARWSENIGLCGFSTHLVRDQTALKQLWNGSEIALQQLCYATGLEQQKHKVFWQEKSKHEKHVFLGFWVPKTKKSQ